MFAGKAKGFLLGLFPFLGVAFVSAAIQLMALKVARCLTKPSFHFMSHGKIGGDVNAKDATEDLEISMQLPEKNPLGSPKLGYFFCLKFCVTKGYKLWFAMKHFPFQPF